jgi:hypothetical protein
VLEQLIVVLEQLIEEGQAVAGGPASAVSPRTVDR